MAESKFKRSEIRKIIGDACTEQMETALVALHLSVLDPLKDDLQRAEDKVKDYDTIKKERDDLKANAGDAQKYADLKKEFAEYKKGVEAKATAAVRDKAVEAYFEGKSITGENLKLAMRAAREEINALAMDGEKIKDTASLDSLVANELKGLVVKNSQRGTPAATPPKNSGGKVMTKEEIYKKDDKGRYLLDAAARQKALAEMAESENNN